MTIQELGVKDLEHVVVKARQQTNLGAKVVEKGEPIIYFENLQIAMLTENSSIIAARGGTINICVRYPHPFLEGELCHIHSGIRTHRCLWLTGWILILYPEGWDMRIARLQEKYIYMS